MADSHSGASVVVVDSKEASEVRHQLACQAVHSSLATVQEVRQLIMLSDIAFTVPYTLRVVVKNHLFSEETKEKIASILEAGFSLCHEILDYFNPKSELSVVNSLPPGQVHTMSKVLQQVMECAISVFRSSGGAFDPALSPVIYYARTYAEENNGASPLSSANPAILSHFKELLEQSNFNNSFLVDLKRGTISRKTPNAKLDFGSIAKGYTVDYVVENLLEVGFRDILFDWGGDIRGVGLNLSNDPWRVAITEPPRLEDIAASATQTPSQRNYIRVMTLNNEAVATSGDYGHPIVRTGGTVSGTFSAKQGKLIGPRTTGIAQASVKSTSCMYADALSTAALVKEQISLSRQVS